MELNRVISGRRPKITKILRMPRKLQKRWQRSIGAITPESSSTSLRGLNPDAGCIYVYRWEEAENTSVKVDGRIRRGRSQDKVVDVTDDGILVQTGVGSLLLTEVQPEGKKRMPAIEFCSRASGQSRSNFGLRFMSCQPHVSAAGCMHLQLLLLHLQSCIHKLHPKPLLRWHP